MRFIEKSVLNRTYSINEKKFLNILFEKINHWLISAHIGDQTQYEFNNNDRHNKEMFNDYLLHCEIRRCFKTIWTTSKKLDNKRILFIERITKETYEQRMKDKLEDKQEFQLFIQSLIGFTKLIHYIRDNYRKPIVG